MTFLGFPKLKFREGSEPKVSCSDCTSACCRDVDILLSRSEAKFLEIGGAALRIVDPGDDLTGMGGSFGSRELYRMTGVCGYVSTSPDGTSVCSQYLDRPAACKTSFKPGSAACHAARIAANLGNTSLV